MKEVKGKQRVVLDAIAGGARTPDAVSHATKFKVSHVYALVYELKKRKLVKLDKEDGGYIAVNGASSTQPTNGPKKGGRSLSDRTIEVLAQLSEGEDTRPASIADKTSLTPGQVQTVLKRCVNMGYVISTGHSKYRLTKSGAAAAVVVKRNGNGHAAPGEMVMEPRSSIPEVRRIQDLCTALFDATRALEPRVMSKKRMALLRGLTQELD